jgi:hypothetical protein
MNLDELHNKLIAVARQNPPGDQVPYAFAQRVMARLSPRSVPDEWASWIRALWCSAAVCAAIPILLGVWTTQLVDEPESGAGFYQDFEQTIFASDDGELI